MTRATEPDEIVEQYWAYDGPHDEETITSATDAIAQLARYLNNATRTSLPAPALYELLGGLDAAANGMRQLVEQLAATAAEYSTDPAVRHDTDRDHAAAACAANNAAQLLRDIPDTLHDLAEQFAEARQPLAHLYHDTDQHEGR